MIQKLSFPSFLSLCFKRPVKLLQTHSCLGTKLSASHHMIPTFEAMALLFLSVPSWLPLPHTGPMPQTQTRFGFNSAQAPFPQVLSFSARAISRLLLPPSWKIPQPSSALTSSLPMLPLLPLPAMSSYVGISTPELTACLPLIPSQQLVPMARSLSTSAAMLPSLCSAAYYLATCL